MPRSIALLGLFTMALLGPFTINSVLAQIQKDALFGSKGTIEEIERNGGLFKIRLQIPIKKLKATTSESNYTLTTLSYNKGSSWETVPVELRTRGHFRLKKCFFPPVKMKFSSEQTEQTPFSGNRKVKLVVPCKNENDKNDLVVKEYLAYKMFEPITPYHYKARLVDLNWVQKETASEEQQSGHQLKAILLEDIEKIADRHKGDEYDKKIHPLRIDSLNAIRNAFFQFMIGNNDYSVVLGHNRKLLFLDQKFVMIPYDFDMSGLVNAEYGRSRDVQALRFSGAQGVPRKYRDVRRNRELLLQVRKEYLDKKPEILDVLAQSRLYFEDPGQYQDAEIYVKTFFQILEDDRRFEKQILKWTSE